MNNFNNEQKYLFSLLCSTINNEQPPEPPESVNFEQIFKLAEYHSVANLVYYGIEKLKNKPDSELMKKWAEVRDREIMRDIIQGSELELITKRFTEENIRFVTLKGTIIKKMYPQSDFRTMGDIDILVDKENLKKAGDILLSMGYNSNLLDHTNHDVYYKAPVMNVEIHHELFNSTRDSFATIFENTWDKTEVVTGARYKLVPDYCFGYVMAHAMGHYKWGGTGIRSFMDLYIYRKIAGHTLDMNRIRGFFEEIGEAELFDSFLELSDVWFGGKTPTDEHLKMAEYILRGGTYGTFENQVIQGMKGKSKGAYLFERLFPNLAYMKEQFPVLKKAPVLLPVFWIVRMIKGATINRKQNMEKFRTFKNN